VAKKLNILWNFLRKLDIINIIYKPIRNPLKAHYEARKITIGFSGFGPKKPDPNRTETGRFGPVLVWFGSLFFCLPVWLFFKGKNRTKPKMITPGCG
jgi:hypothetical protein